MRRRFTILSWSALVLIFLISFDAWPQVGSKKKHKDKPKPDCSGTCFSAEVISEKPGADGCTDIEMKVSHDGRCRYELSHFTVELPCGFVRNVHAPGCDYDFGKDPTTGLKGLKIDDIRNFGKGFPKSFVVKFTWCNNSCQSSDCWEPRVAFKAATCVDYDTARNSCELPPLNAIVQKQNASCSGAADGTLVVTAEGGEGPYSYNWSTGCDMPTIDNLPAGTYTVTITDAQGNEITVTQEIISTSNLVLTAATVNPNCLGATNGAIDLSVQGGIEPYTYRWSTGATTQDLTTLPVGSYRVTVTDSAGCSKETTFQLTSPVILASGQLTRPGCGQANGQINLSVSGGAAPYTFLWSNGSTSEDATGLTTGLYNVLVTDANGCSTRPSFFLAENNTLRITFVVTPTSCLDNNSGAIDLTVTGGTPPYAYHWQNGSTTEDLTELPTGTQRVTVTDATGCTATALINVFKQAFQVLSQVKPPSCEGQADAAITLTPGGEAPFMFLWSTGATTSSIANLSSGLYSVTVTDNTGCSQFLNYFIQDPVINAFTVVSNPDCGAEGMFAIDLSVSGGVAPYTYGWSNGETTQDINGLNSGNYQVTITDANGCSKIVEVVVQPVVVDWSCSITPPVKYPVCGSSGNQLGTSVAGATYAWSVDSDDDLWTITSGQLTSSITYTAGGNATTAEFTVAITKAGCTQTCSYTVSACVPVVTCGLDTTSLPPIVVLPQNPPPDPKLPGSSEPSDNSDVAFRFAAYPNPIVDKLSLDWTAEASEYVRIDIIDLYGKRIAELYSGDVRAGEAYRIEWNPVQLNEHLYFYRYTSASRTMYGKIFKGN